MSCPRRGLSLLEVILALAILAGALAVLGELVRVGGDSGATARDLTTAQIYCQNKMEEIAAGLLPAQPMGPVAVEEDLSGQWQYTITADPLDDQGLLAVTVTVHQDATLSSRPVSFTLVRWMIDPALEYAAAGSEASGATGSSGASSSSSSSTGGF